MSALLRDVTAGEQQSALSRACCVAAGALSAAISAAATDKHLQNDLALGCSILLCIAKSPGMSCHFQGTFATV